MRRDSATLVGGGIDHVDEAVSVLPRAMPRRRNSGREDTVSSYT